MSTTFIDRYLAGTSDKANIYLVSLENDRGGAEKHIASRDPKKLEAFIAKYDVPGRGVYHTVSTINGPKRNKSTCYQTAFAHADIDFKSVALSQEEILVVLEGLAYPPSEIYASGNGLHCYWWLDKATPSGEHVENVLKKLAKVIGGDPAVCHCAALMRMPGSHNSKRGEWKEVVAIKLGGLLTSLLDLDEWQPGVVILPLPKAGATGATKGETNPYLAFAERNGFKPPIDVEARLANMTYQGAGDSAIHTTQLSVTASLLSSGEDIDAVVDRVLDATKEAAGDARWNWKKEEIDIRRMCDDWLKKQPAMSTTNKVVTGDNVVDLKTVRQEKAEPKSSPATKGKPDKPHIIVGKTVIAAIKQRGDDILFSEEQMWICRDGLWAAVANDKAGAALLDRQAQTVCDAIKMPTNSRLRSEARGWVQCQPSLYRQEVPWNRHGGIAMANGLLGWKTGVLEPLVSSHYATRRVPYEYSEAATCPVWEEALADTISKEKVNLLQEIAGVALIDDKPRGLMRALVLHGGSNSGKSTIINVLAGLVGGTVNPTSFKALENPHGLMPFRKPGPWVLHEAFEASEWHFSAAPKALLSGDTVIINIKNGAIIPYTWDQPAFWATNYPPQFKEATRAMQNRLIIMSTPRAFDQDKPTGAAVSALKAGYDKIDAYVIDRELPGVFNWALVGLKRAMERGYFINTDEGKESLHAMHLEGNVAAGFMEDCVTKSPGRMINKPDFHGALQAWWMEKYGGTYAPVASQIGKHMKSLGDEDIGEHNGKLARSYTGIELNELGLEFWQTASAVEHEKRTGVRMSSGVGEVGKKVPK
jgi:phage/plasmid-associated DNA primase